MVQPTNNQIECSKKVSATEPDFSREKIKKFWDPSRKLIKSIRDYQKYAKNNSVFAKIYKKTCILRHRFWSLVTGAEIDLNCKIEGGLKIPHPNGIVIHPKASLGPNCLIFQQVTLVGAVECGGHVDIGAGAKILGPIKIGSHVRIGANAVVTKDIPSNCTVAGVPAKIIQKTE